jgi:WD40 repeat protein
VASAVGLSADGITAIVGMTDGSIELRNISDLSAQRVLVGHEDAVSGVALSQSGRRVVSSSWDGTVRLWDVDALAKPEIWREHTDRVLGLSMSPDGELIATVSADGTTRIWEVPGGESFAVPTHGIPISVAIRPGAGGMAARGLTDGTVELWAWDGPLNHIPAHEDPVRSLVYLPSGQTGVSVSGDGTVAVWSQRGGILQRFSGPLCVTTLAAAGNDHVIIGDEIGQIHVLAVG